MKNLLCALAGLLSLHAYSQTAAQVDSLCNAMCKTLLASKAATVDDKLSELYSNHLDAFYTKFPVTTEAEAQASQEMLTGRMTKLCTAFTAMINAANGTDPYADEWLLLKEPPASKVNKKECRTLANYSSFYYYERGKTVAVTIKNGIYTENFEDGSYSKLEFKWNGDCGFDLVFIESNNTLRKDLSRKGDVYHYAIYEKYDDKFMTWIAAPDGVIMASPLYIKK